MRGEDLVVGGLYRVKHSTWSDHEHCIIEKGSIVECTHKRARPGGVSSFRVVKPVTSALGRGQAGQQLSLTDHTCLEPVDDTLQDQAPRARRAAALRRKIESNSAQITKLSEQVQALREENSVLEKKATALEEFESDEAELAHMLHKLLTQRDTLTPEVIEEVLKSRVSTNNL